jgi:hypothetical protein
MDRDPALPTSCDIAGAWLLCAVIAAVALGVLRCGMSWDMAAAVLTRSDVTLGGTASATAAQAPGLRLLAGSQHLFVPAPHPDHLRHG